MRIISVGISSKKLIVIKGADYSLRTEWRIKLYSYEMQKFSVYKLSLIMLSVTIYIYSVMNDFLSNMMQYKYLLSTTILFYNPINVLFFSIFLLY